MLFPVWPFCDEPARLDLMASMELDTVGLSAMQNNDSAHGEHVPFRPPDAKSPAFAGLFYALEQGIIPTKKSGSG
jgi:hypothetical protein